MTTNAQQTQDTASRTSDQAQQKAGQIKDQAQEKLQSAKQTGQQLAQPTQEAFNQFTEQDNPVKGYEAFWEKLPTNYYFWGAGASMLTSALLLLAGKQKLAIFVGLWPMTILNGAVMMKALRPSKEV